MVGDSTFKGEGSVYEERAECYVRKVAACAPCARDVTFRAFGVCLGRCDLKWEPGLARHF